MKYSKNLIPDELNEKGFWSSCRRRVLFALLAQFGGIKRISKSDHLTVKKLISNAQKLSTYQIENCNAVLSKLEGIDWDIRYLDLPQKKERPSALPSTTEELQLYASMIQKRNEIWSNELANNYSITVIEKGIELELAAAYGLAPNHIKSFFNTFPLSVSGNKLRIQPHPSCIDAPSCNFPLSARMTALLFHLSKHQEERINTLNQHSYALHYKHKELHALAKHTTIAGVEPIISTQLQKNVLPVSPLRMPNNYCVERFQASDYPCIYQRFNTETTHNERLNESKESKERYKKPRTASKSSSIIELPYSSAAINALRSSQLKLKQALKIGGVYKSSKVDLTTFKTVFGETKSRFLELLREYVATKKLSIDERQSALDYIETLSSQTTPIDLALNIAFDQLINRQNKSETLFDYLSNVFYHGFFLYEECFDLSQWSHEDTDLFQADFLSDLEAHYEPNTVKKILTSFSYVIDFAKKNHGVMNEFETAQLKLGAIALTSRNNIIGLIEFYKIIRKILRKGDDNSLTIAVLMVLEFYGFMRTSEITRLTLNDIEIYDHEIMVRVRDSKTPSGKRTIPLNLLIPPYHQSLLRDLVDIRIRHYRVATNKYKISKTKSGQERLIKKGLPFPEPPPPLKDLPLLSFDGSFDFESTDSVIKLALARIKELAGPTADLYLLRHSGGSHLFNRWYASRYEDYIQELSDRTHWVYSEDGLAGIKEFFIEPRSEPLSLFNTSSITHLIKLFGHANTNTFFSVYVHSFDLVASHALKRVFKQEDSLELNGKTIGALIPNMRSRTSRARIKDTCIKALVETYVDTISRP